MYSIVRGISHVIKKQKTPVQIIEENFGKGPQVKSDKKIRIYLESKGYKSLSELIEAK